MARNADESKVSEADAFSARVLIPRLLREHAFGNWKRYVSAFALMAVAAACTALTAYLAGDIVNQAYVHRDMGAIITLCIAIVFIFTAKGLATYGHAVILARIANRIVANNQRRVFEKLLSESLSFFSTRHSSEFVARLSYGATAASSVLNLLITAFGRDLLSLIGLVTVMIVQDPALSLVGLVVMPPAILFVRKLVRRARGIAMNQFTGGARIQEIMQESLQGLRIVKAFSLEDEMRKRLDENVDKVQAESNKMARVANRSSPLMESLGGVAIALVFLYAGYRVLETGAAPGEFFSFITAFLLAYEPAKRLARLNIEIQAHLVGVRLLYEVLDSPRTESDDDGKPRLDVRAGLVEFDRVSFSYRPGEPVIRDLSFVAEKGRVTALVGPSGGGKSTVLNLILRLYEIDGGAILIDGQNLQSVSRRSLREQIAFVGQDVHLFRGTVRDNIRFGQLEASDADVIAAARAAFADEFIMAFPNGYDTPVGEQGLQLSGGQRQRIAIARALIRSAPIILLDEATAALDSESEHQVQSAIRHLCEGRTTIVIAHRLQTIMHADRIHVIEKGGIVESGRHEELLRRQGRYAAFYKLQLRDQETTREHPSLASSA